MAKAGSVFDLCYTRISKLYVVQDKMEWLLTLILNWMPQLVLYATTPFLLGAIILVTTRVWTTLRYYYELHQFNQSDHNDTATKTIESPRLPYSIPWLGHTLSFCHNKTPGGFYDDILRWYPRRNGIMTVLIAGRTTHIVFAPPAVQAIFRARSVHRDDLAQNMFGKVLGMEADQVDKALACKNAEAEMNSRYMTNFHKVNELTSKFTEILDDVLAKEDLSKLKALGLYEWLRDHMFEASVTALMGDQLLKVYPDWAQDFWKWDNELLGFLYGIPAILQRDAERRRRKIFASLEKWSLEMTRLSGGAPVDPDDGPAWEPFFGSRLNRARQLDYKARGLNSQSGAMLDAGITFALQTNVIPATGFMLLNIVQPNAPPDLLPRVLAEINEARIPDSTSFDVVKLVSQPLLQSIWNETLRLYNDALVVRNLPDDVIVPLDRDGKLQTLLHEGDDVLMPAWIPQRDHSWGSNGVPWDVFDADRFLEKDPKTGKEKFVLSSSKAAGRLFPFGGGTSICPGRIFAKQEGIAAVAIILSRFEFTSRGFVDVQKQPTTVFPSVKNAYPGTGSLAPNGDLIVEIRKRVL